MHKEKISTSEGNGPTERRDDLLREYEDECADPLVSKIVTGMNGRWDTASREQQENITTRFDEFLKALRNYFDSYDGHKIAASRQRMLLLDDIERYQRGVENADKRERALHNNFVDATNILSRAMKDIGMNNGWRGDSMIFHIGGTNDTTDEMARDLFREWMMRIYHETFPL